MPKKLNIYFPLNNINPQGWITEFITPVLNRTGTRDPLSSLLYDSDFDNVDGKQTELVNELKKVLGADFEKYNDLRKSVSKLQDEKFTYLNGNHLDLLQVDETLKGPQLKDVDLQRYFNFMSSAKPYQLAFLQPYLKLKYGFRNNKKEEFQWVDFPFTQKYDINFILSEKTHARSEGCGITNVSVLNKFNPATQVNSNIGIKFFFGNMKILTQEITEDGVAIRDRPKDDKFKYGFSFTKLVANLSIDTEAIKLEYGRKVAPGFEKLFDKGQELKAIIEKKEKKEYLLSKYSHTFSFEEDGSISLGVEYYNFHDSSLFEKNNISVPSSTPENVSKLKLKLNQGSLVESYKKLNDEITSIEDTIQNTKNTLSIKSISKLESDQKTDKISFLTKRLSKANKTLTLLKRSLKQNLTTIFLDKIKEDGQLYSISFNTKKTDSNSFVITPKINLISHKTGDFLPLNILEPNSISMDSFRKNATIQNFYKTNIDFREDLLERILGRILNTPYNQESKTSSYGHIMFFPLKALIAAAYSFLEEKERVNIPHIIFGNINLTIGDRTCSVNVGDLLVESTILQKWYYNVFFKKDRLEYSFGAFIADIINELIPEILYRNKVGFDNKAPTSTLNKTTYYLVNPIDTATNRKVYNESSIENLKKLSEKLSKTPSNRPQPVIYYGQKNNISTQIPSPIFAKYGNGKFNFNELDDFELGIPHFKIGADGGFVQSVDFNASDFSKIRSALALEALADRASRYFFFYYQLDLTTLGNNMFSYDSIICVPSNPLGIDSEINDPGIAGYYKIVETQDTFSANSDYITTAKADWFYNPKNEKQDTNKLITTPSNTIINITDTIPISVNDPVEHVIELLENDAVGIINAELQKMTKVEKKASKTAKKDNSKKTKPSTIVDREEQPKIPVKPGNNKG